MFLITSKDKKDRWIKWAEVSNIDMLIIVGSYLLTNYKPNDDFLIYDDNTDKIYSLKDFMQKFTGAIYK